MNKVEASVVICTRNRSIDLEKCLSSIVKQTIVNFEFIIVDSSDKEEQEKVKLVIDRVKNKVPLSYVHTKPGLTYQRNVGIKKAAGKLLYFFDDDVILENSYLESMQQVFRNNSEYGGGMGAITNIRMPNGIFWRFLRRFFFLSRSYSKGFFTLSGMPTHTYGTQVFKDVQVLGGCCMAFRKELLQKNKFDEKLVGYGYMEDCDISWRVAKESKLFFNPAARLQHNSSPPVCDKKAGRCAMFMKHYRYLYFKNIYVKNKLTYLAYLWSIAGLFIYSFLLRDWQSVKGYYQGLKQSV